MDFDQTLQKVRELLEPIVVALGYQLVEAEIRSDRGGMALVLYIEMESGPITVDDCKQVSHACEGPLDVADLIDQHYFLEVSSPGIERPLRKREDFKRFAGNQVSIKTNYPIDGRKNYTGELKGVEEEAVCMLIGDNEFKLPLSSIAKARLKPKFEFKKKG